MPITPDFVILVQKQATSAAQKVVGRKCRQNWEVDLRMHLDSNGYDSETGCDGEACEVFKALRRASRQALACRYW